MIRHRAPRDRRLDLVVGAVVTTALAIFAGALAVTLPSAAPEPLTLALVSGLVIAGDLALVQLRFGRASLSFTWGETAMLLGIVLIGPADTVLVAAPSVLVAHLIAGRRWQKACYNAATFTVATAAGASWVNVVGDGSLSLRSVPDVVAMLLACATFALVSHLLTCLAVATASRASYRQVLCAGIHISVVVWAGNLLCGGVLLAGLELSPVALAGVPPVVLVIAFAYRATLSAVQERDVWRQLEGATRELNRLDEGDVARAALTRAAALLRCDSGELTLDGRGQSRTYVLANDEVTLDLSSGHATTPVVEDDDLLSVQVVSVPRATSVTWVVKPLTGPRGRLGELRLCFPGRVSLTRREEQVLSTFTHSMSTTLQNAALHAEVRAEADQHAHDASHDALTGLANRTLLAARTSAAMASGVGCALLLLDLDHFKEINDTLGHAAGDQLLQQVARRLESGVRDGDTVARLGGDEFAVLLVDLADPRHAEPVAEDLLRLLAEPVEFEGLRLSVEASLGVACHPHDADSADELFRRADVAMYQAKSARGSWVRYSSDRDDSSIHRLSLVAELRSALERDEITVHFQPQQDLETGQVVGAEALARWQHPERGLLAPAEFVAIAEQSGLVRPFTLRVLDLAVAECARWQRGGRPVTVAVNIAARSLLDRELPNDVASVLARHGLPPDRLVLEITESHAASELEVVEDVLWRLRQLGVEISVDDFGTGYSSLAFLQRTAVHELKVDRSFVSRMLDSDNDLALVRATVSLAHSLNARAVAEGVESEDVLAALVSLGCDSAQGYWLSAPVPAARMRGFLDLEEALFPGLAAELAARVPAPRDEAPVRHLRAVGHG